MALADLLKNEYIRGGLILAVGITIGVLFYPSKRVEEKVSQKYEQEITALKEAHSKEVQTLNEAKTKVEAEAKEYHTVTEKKIASLTTQVSELKSKQKIATYKLVKPDGTIEERTYTENEIDQSTKTVVKIQEEFKQKVDSIEQKWSQIHETRVAALKKEFDSKESEYQKTIASYESHKVTETNQKRFGLEAGITNERNYYGHATADLWGPVFVGVHGQVGANGNNANNMGLGLGLRF